MLPARDLSPFGFLRLDMRPTHAVLPEAGNSTAKVDSPTHDNSYHADWSNVKSQAQTTDDALKSAAITKGTVYPVCLAGDHAGPPAAGCL